MSTDNDSAFLNSFALEAFLGREAGGAVSDAAQWFEHDPKSLKAHEAAVRAARLAIPKLCALAKVPNNMASAFSAICEALEAVERDLRQITPDKKRGPRGASQHELQFRARAVFAVEWLGRVKWERMPRDKALAAVAALIPESMLLYRGNRYSGQERLTAWIDSFSRTGRHPQNAKAMKAVKHEIWTQFEALDRDETAASPETVLEWLANSLRLPRSN